jgi:hypothetical protein
LSLLLESGQVVVEEKKDVMGIMVCHQIVFLSTLEMVVVIMKNATLAIQ